MGDKLPQHVDRRHWVLSGIVAIAVILVWFHGVLGPVPDVVAAEQQLAPITTVYIVRHAERADDSANTPLSAAGRARAQELVHVLGNDDLDAVFVTNLTRTQQTGAPLAAAKGIMAEQYPASDPQSVVNTILTDHLGDRVLVVGHSDTVDDIAGGLGATELSDLGGDQFDRLFVIHRFANVAHLDRLRYGAETP